MINTGILRPGDQGYRDVTPQLKGDNDGKNSDVNRDDSGQGSGSGGDTGAVNSSEPASDKRDNPVASE